MILHLSYACSNLGSVCLSKIKIPLGSQALMIHLRHVKMWLLQLPFDIIIVTARVTNNEMEEKLSEIE